MRAVVAALILGVGIVNLLPAIGVFSARRLQSLYGVVIEDPNLVILMRHRAVLFAIVGALLVGDYNPALRRIVLIDVVASIGLLLAGVVSYGPESIDRIHELFSS